MKCYWSQGNYMVNLLKLTLIFRTWIARFGHRVWVCKLAAILTSLCSVICTESREMWDVFHPSQPMPGGFPLGVFFHPQRGSKLFWLEPSHKADWPGQNLFWVMYNQWLYLFYHHIFITKPEWISLLGCFIACMKWNPQIHLWCDTCSPVGGQHGSWAILIFVLVNKHWWGLRRDVLCMPLPHTSQTL